MSELGLRRFAGCQRAFHDLQDLKGVPCIQLPDGQTWYGWHDLVAQLGTEYTGRDLPLEYEPGEPQWCYANAYELAKANPDELRYVEGLATKPGLIIPIAHAWCIDADGQVVDPTWHGRWSGVSGNCESGGEYLGIIIPTWLVHACYLKNDQHWSVLDSDWLGEHWFLEMGWREVVHEQQPVDN